MFHHNVITREQYNYINPLTRKYQPIDSPELMNDWDSLAEVQIWMDYLLKRTGKSDVSSVTAISRLFTNKLTAKSKYKDTLSLLRSKPQFIKNRNFRPSRDNIKEIDMVDTSRDTTRETSDIDIFKPPEIIHTELVIEPSNVSKTNDNNLADKIGL